MKDKDQLLKEITELYLYYKELALYAEELRTESFLPPINEIKDAFDHLMRTYSVTYGFKEKNGDYIITNLEATFRHLYRAVFDLFDYIRIYQKDIIDQKIDGFSRVTLTDVFPEYFQEIVPGMDRCMKEIPLYKSEKDIGDPDLNTVKKYLELVRQLRDYTLKIDEKLPALIQYQEKMKKEKRIDYFILFIIGAIGAIFGAIVGGIAVYLITH